MHPPEVAGGPRAAGPVAADPAVGGEQTDDAGGDAGLGLVLLAPADGDLLAQGGYGGGDLAAGGRPLGIEGRERVGFRLGEPGGIEALAVLGEVLEEGAAFLGGDTPGGGGVHVRGEFGGDGEERVAHAEQPDVADILIEGLLDLGRAVPLGEAGAGGEEDGRGVGGVQGDDGVRRLGGAGGPGGGSQAVPAPEPVAALGRGDEGEAGAHPPDRRPGRRQRPGPAGEFVRAAA
ncbi:hypothetical protein GCM10020254_44110 [Streptomyces goshikiensis]